MLKQMIADIFLTGGEDGFVRRSDARIPSVAPSSFGSQASNSLLQGLVVGTHLSQMPDVDILLRMHVV